MKSKHMQGQMHGTHGLYLRLPCQRSNNYACHTHLHFWLNGVHAEAFPPTQMEHESSNFREFLSPMVPVSCFRRAPQMPETDIAFHFKEAELTQSPFLSTNRASSLFRDRKCIEVPKFVPDSFA